MLNAAVQNKAFPLAGLMYANVNVWSKAARRQIATNSDVWNLSKPDICHRQIFTNLGVFGTSTHAHECEAGITVPANASSSFSRRGDEESFETSTRAGKRSETDYLEDSVSGAGGGCGAHHTVSYKLPHRDKKGLPTIANPVYGYSAPAKSGAGIGVLQLSTAHNRAKCGFFVCVARLHPSMVGWARASKDAPVSVEAGTPTSLSSPPAIGVFGGDCKNHSTEAAAMLATTPTQNPQFIWIIAAVRRDMTTIKAQIHHIAAPSERDARRSLVRDHVCFFAGRIRLEVAHA